MAKYQSNKNELARQRFFEIFGDLETKEKLKLVISLSKITEVIRL